MNKYTPLSTDEKLIAQLRNNDRAAFEVIYNKYVSGLFITAYSVLQDDAASKKLVQNVLMQLWINRMEGDITPLQTYLWHVLKQRILETMLLNSMDDEQAEADHGIFSDEHRISLLEHSLA